MTYYPDLGTETMVWSGPNIRAVGWLSPKHEFTRGTVESGSLKLLQEHIDNVYVVVIFMGPHECEFCRSCLHGSNVIIPTEHVVYIAPGMITHYIEAHGYQPPAEFLAAVRECPPQGSAEYLRRLRNCFHYDPMPSGKQIEELALMVDKGLEEIAELCREKDTIRAMEMAYLMSKAMKAIHGLEGWHRHLFARSVQCLGEPVFEKYLAEFNAIFGEDTAVALPRPRIAPEFQSMD